MKRLIFQEHHQEVLEEISALPLEPRLKVWPVTIHIRHVLNAIQWDAFLQIVENPVNIVVYNFIMVWDAPSQVQTVAALISSQRIPG